MNNIRRVFKWLSRKKNVPVTVYQELTTVEGLRFGQCSAKEGEPVLPVADVVVAATLLHRPEVVADMVRLQVMTGMRSGELVILRPCDVDTTGAEWWYTPPKHKTAYKGKIR